MPPAGPRLSPPETVGAFAVALLSLLVAAPMLYRALGLPAMAIIQLLLIAGPVVLIALARAGATREAAHMLGLRVPRGRALAGAVLLGSSFWYLNLLFVAPIAHRYLGGDELVRSIDETILSGGAPLWVIVLVVSFFPALCEEVLMRGALARSFEPSLGRVLAVLVSAALFGAMHIHPAQVLTTFTFGLILGYAAVASDSALPAIVMHVLNNALVLVIGAEVIPDLTGSLRANPLPWGATAGILSISGILLIRKGAHAADRNPS